MRMEWRLPRERVLLVEGAKILQEFFLPLHGQLRIVHLPNRRSQIGKKKNEKLGETSHLVATSTHITSLTSSR
jgi:hypothetical protein